MPDINRLRQLAGLETADEVVSQEDQDRLDAEEDDRSDRLYQLEKQARSIVLQTLRRVGLDPIKKEHASYATDTDASSYEMYIEMDTGECVVDVESCSLDNLVKLSRSGVGTNFVVRASGELQITFTLSQAIVAGKAKLQ
jgi:hypothetical protein